MNSFNNVYLSGHLSRDAEIKQISEGRYVLSFPVAVTRSHRNSAGETVDDVSFVDIERWGNESLNKLATRLVKGSLVFIEGYLKQSRWERDGQKRSSIRIVANNIQAPIVVRPAVEYATVEAGFGAENGVV